jgi:hypothetical protein
LVLSTETKDFSNLYNIDGTIVDNGLIHQVRYIDVTAKLSEGINSIDFNKY